MVTYSRLFQNSDLLDGFPMSFVSNKYQFVGKWNEFLTLSVLSFSVFTPSPPSYCPWGWRDGEISRDAFSLKEGKAERKKKSWIKEKEIWNWVKSPVCAHCDSDSRGLTQRSLASHPASPSVLSNWKALVGVGSTCWGENWGPWTRTRSSANVAVWPSAWFRMHT